MFCECETEVRGVKGKIIGLKILLDKNNTNQICSAICFYDTGFLKIQTFKALSNICRELLLNN